MPTSPLDPSSAWAFSNGGSGCLAIAGSTSPIKPDIEEVVERHLPTLPLEVQYLIIQHAGLDHPSDWDNYDQHVSLLRPLLFVCRAWLPAVQAELVREMTVASPDQAQMFLQHVNNHRLLRLVKVLRIGGKDAQPWPALVKADAMGAHLLMRQCDGLVELWVRNLHLVDFDDLLVSKSLRSLFVFCCSFISDLPTPPSSRPVSRAASRAASRSNSRASTPRPFTMPTTVHQPFLSHLYLVNCRLPASRLASLTSESLPALKALGFGSNWLEDPYHPHSDEFMTDITLGAVDPSLLPSLRCLSAGDDLDQILTLMPSLALLDCWESSLTNKVAKTVPSTLRRLRLCESALRLAILGLPDDEDDHADWEKMAPLIRQMSSLPKLAEVHLPSEWEQIERYEELVGIARGRGVKVQWETDVEKSGFDLMFWNLVDEVEKEDQERETTMIQM